MRGSPPFPAGWRSRGPGPVLTGSVFAPSTEAGDHQSHGAADRSHQQRGLRGVHVSTDVVARLSPPCGPRPSDRTCDVAAGALFRGAEGSSGPEREGQALGLGTRSWCLCRCPAPRPAPRPQGRRRAGMRTWLQPAGCAAYTASPRSSGRERSASAGAPPAASSAGARVGASF